MGIPCSLDPLGSISYLRKNTVLVNQSGGEVYSVYIPENGVYQIRCTGSGGYGGGRNSSLSHPGGGGGSGGTILIEVYLKRGIYYYYGAKSLGPTSGEFYSDGAWFSPQSSYGPSTCICHAGGGKKPGNTGGGGVGGSSFSTNNFYGYLNIISQVNGNSGTDGNIYTTHGKGGVSVDPEYGRGGDGTTSSGTSYGASGNPGRIVVTYLRKNP